MTSTRVFVSLRQQFRHAEDIFESVENLAERAESPRAPVTLCDTPADVRTEPGRAVSRKTTACTRVRTRAVENAVPGKFRSVRARRRQSVRVPKSVCEGGEGAVGPSPGKSRPVSRLRNNAVECRPCPLPFGRETRIHLLRVSRSRGVRRVIYSRRPRVALRFSHVCFSARRFVFERDFCAHVHSV